MGFYSEIRNQELIKELQRELNTDVLLFGVDGFTYFGNLQAIHDCRIAVLTPAIQADTTDVEILTPGGELRTVEFLRVDLWTIVAKGTGIVSDPIDDGPSLVSAAPPVPVAVREEDTSAESSGEPLRQESHQLINQLRRMIGDSVTITTLGGFLFDGILGDVCGELAILTVNDIFVPGTSDSISDDDVRSVVVNLEALTAVAGTNTSVS